MEPTIENTKPIPILVSRFTEIRNKPNLEPTIEDFSDIFSNEDNRKHSFEEVKKAFEFIFNKEKFIHSLNKEPNKESFAYLKQVRRYRVILRDHCRFFSLKISCISDNSLTMCLIKPSVSSNSMGNSILSI